MLGALHLLRTCRRPSRLAEVIAMQLSRPSVRPSPAARALRAAVLVAALTLAPVAPALAAPAVGGPPSGGGFGDHVIVFDPSMPTSDIRATFDRISAQQVDDEMGAGRWSLLFKPGTYGTDAEPLQVKVGYYTEVAGLGASPADVVVNGKIEVYNRCLDNGGTSNCVALNTFWRSLSNLTLRVNGAGQDGCRASSNFWAVSQAVSVRRVDVQGGNLSLMDYCTAGPQYASGGFIADSRAGVVINGSQQQWLIRNSEVGVWTNAVWNQVFAGVVGAPDASAFPNPPYTTLERTPLSREKPLLNLSADGQWQVTVPYAAAQTRGTTWATGATPGRTVPLSAFFVAHPGDSLALINAALAAGKNLLLTPGVYDVDRSIVVRRAGQIVLGMGMATLTSVNGATPLVVEDRAGIVVAGITVDAGPTTSEALLTVGAGSERGGARPGGATAADPLTLSDVFFRVGGPHPGSTKAGMVIDSDHVLVDHTWVWRADHGVESGFTAGVLGDTDRWRVNTAANGLIVNGADVTATGLFIEHFQQHNTVWNGERGQVIFFQNELPYDPPSQADWTQPDRTLGYPAYVVGAGVQDHRLWGGGSYVYNRNNPAIVTAHSFQVPDRPGVVLTHVLTVNLGAGTIQHVVNDTGAQVDTGAIGVPSYLVSYP